MPTRHLSIDSANFEFTLACHQYRTQCQGQGLAALQLHVVSLHVRVTIRIGEETIRIFDKLRIDKRICNFADHFAIRIRTPYRILCLHFGVGSVLRIRIPYFVSRILGRVPYYVSVFRIYILGQVLYYVFCIPYSVSAFWGWLHIPYSVFRIPYMYLHVGAGSVFRIPYSYSVFCFLGLGCSVRAFHTRICDTHHSSILYACTSIQYTNATVQAA
jgi:hypothetical protein